MKIAIIETNNKVNIYDLTDFTKPIWDKCIKDEAIDNVGYIADLIVVIGETDDDIYMAAALATIPA
jgi:hypothetical protein